MTGTVEAPGRCPGSGRVAWQSELIDRASAVVVCPVCFLSIGSRGIAWHGDLVVWVPGHTKDGALA